MSNNLTKRSKSLSNIYKYQINTKMESFSFTNLSKNILVNFFLIFLRIFQILVINLSQVLPNHGEKEFCESVLYSLE